MTEEPIDFDAEPVAEQTQPDSASRSRYRIVFAKEGTLRYIAHLDLARLWERVLRRAKMPLAYSQGFNPRPRLQLAAALPLGYTGMAEIVDIWLMTTGLADLEAAQAGIQAASPPGLRVVSMEPADLREPPLQVRTRSGTYVVRFPSGLPSSADALRERISAILGAETLVVRRRKGEGDLRPLIFALRLVTEPSPVLEMGLALAEQGTTRPDEVMALLGVDPVQTDISRTGITYDQVKLLAADR
ncbi:MAG: DUF2344 domain-containing protein, partial [Anaerolineae bacterium]|nr:DUF2344 domain-containing protein [Anaerolineae bacterium]